ncbi:hypothetical protein EZV62_018387 [Acer yangbiense]|uniref:Neprosin PEP catalytic domain-containing protein n=1 Tax=Acer yangbiense TaxID=1000413 RepID=A0A5C7HJP0_9ROSI|nr:hypothetical protein EZV62_018387 [Acer yangbiense]
MRSGKRRKVTVENSDSRGSKLARKQNAVTDADGGNSTTTMEHILPILYEVGVEVGGDNSEPDGETKMNPSLLPKSRRNSELSSSKESSFEQQGKGCPSGMYAVFQTKPNTNVKYNGAKAIIDLYNPAVKQNQISMAQIWIEAGPPAELNGIQVGWAVHPHLYGDNKTRVTAYWTADQSQKTGCYNSICPGFVQVHPSERLGQDFGAVSVIDGQQYGTTPMIYKDPNTGNWWLVVENRISIGYWPKELFTHLNDGASFVQYGGWTYNSPDGLSPPMGSGRFASGNLKQSCFFAQIELMNTNNNLVDATEDILQRFVDSDKCYSAKFWGYQGSVLGQSFSFGGPGGQCNAA